MSSCQSPIFQSLILVQKCKVYLSKVRDATWYFVHVPDASVLIHYSQADGKLPHRPIRSG